MFFGCRFGPSKRLDAAKYEQTVYFSDQVSLCCPNYVCNWTSFVCTLTVSVMKCSPAFAWVWEADDLAFCVRSSGMCKYPKSANKKWYITQYVTSTWWNTARDLHMLPAIHQPGPPIHYIMFSFKSRIPTLVELTGRKWIDRVLPLTHVCSLMNS